MTACSSLSSRCSTSAHSFSMRASRRASMAAMRASTCRCSSPMSGAAAAAAFRAAAEPAAGLLDALLPTAKLLNMARSCGGRPAESTGPGAVRTVAGLRTCMCSLTLCRATLCGVDSDTSLRRSTAVPQGRQPRRRGQQGGRWTYAHLCLAPPPCRESQRIPRCRPLGAHPCRCCRCTARRRQPASWCEAPRCGRSFSRRLSPAHARLEG